MSGALRLLPYTLSRREQRKIPLTLRANREPSQRLAYGLDNREIVCFLLGNSPVSEFHMPPCGSLPSTTSFCTRPIPVLSPSFLLPQATFEPSFSLINTLTFLKPSHSSHLPAYEDGTDRVFRNVGIYNSNAGELPRRKHITFRTRRKFEIKNREIDSWQGRERFSFPPKC
jgi:hypothetical protein